MGWRNGWRCLLMLIGWGLLLVHAAQGATLDVGESHQGGQSLAEYLAVLEDPSRTLTLNDVQRPESRFQGSFAPAAGLNFGYTQSAYWLRLRLNNSSDVFAERLIEIAYSKLTRVEFYRTNAAGDFESVTTGLLAPFATRPYPNRFFVFPVALPAHGEQTYYFRVEASSALQVPARLWTPVAFHEHERSDYAFQAWYFGVATAMILFNLLLFIALKDVIYLMYVGFVSAMTFTVASHQGLVKEFIGADSPAWSLSSASVGYCLTIALMILFTRHMLATRIALPRTDRLFRFLAGIYLLPLPLAVVVAHQAVIQTAQYVSLFTMLLIIGVGIRCAFMGQRTAYYFVAAYAALFLAAGFTGLTGLGWIPLYFDAAQAVQLGSAAEMLLLAFALADRFNQMRLEKEKAQQNAADAQSLLVETLRTSERTLESRVAQRTAELRQFIDMLSHEIKTPMSVIRMCLGMETPAVSVKRHAQQAIQDIDAIIERCLQADRLDHSAVNLRRQPCHVDAMVDALRSACANPERLAVQCSGAPLLDTDVQLLNVVLSNLIDNALKYAAPESVVRIEIAETQHEGAAGVQLAIANSPGTAGMPDSERVFEKYYRSPGAHGKSGSGLGLYLVSRIVQLLGGTIRYCPTGTEVRFELWMPR